MTTDVLSPNDIIALTASLRTRLEGDVADGESPPLTEQLQDDLLRLLDAIPELAEEESAHGSTPAAPAPLVDHISEVIANTLAPWQAQIATAFDQAAASELRDQLKLATELVAEAEQRQTHLVEQRSKLEAELADYLRLNARLSRQRQTLAKELRARRAEMLLEVERSRQAVRAEIEGEVRQQLQQQLREDVDAAQSALEQRLRGEAQAAWQVRETQLHAESKTALTALESSLQTQARQQREALQAELTELNAEHDGATRQVIALTEQNERLEQQLLDLQALVENSPVSAEDQPALAAFRRELQAAQSQLERYQQERSDAEPGEDSQARRALEDELCQTRQQLSETQSQIEAVQLELAEARQLLEQSQPVDPSATENAAAQQEQLESMREQLEATRQQLDETLGELHTTRRELQTAQAEIEQSRTEVGNATGNAEALAVNAEQLEELKRQLSEKQLEIFDLRGQNSDLASQVAKHQMATKNGASSSNINQESLSWEERKKLIMQKLESEVDEGESDELAAKRLEVDEIIAATQQEVERRDQEIAELQRIIEQQSDTREGVAIGAAAIAQMLDSDDLISQERQKLKDIQQQWEEKLRQAEIDLSMERAKLARERTQLELELERAREAAREQALEAAQGGEHEKGQGRTRKWLEHLGLKEERS